MIAGTALVHIGQIIFKAEEMIRRADHELEARSWESLRSTLDKTRQELERAVDDLDRNMSLLIVETWDPTP